MQDYYAVLEVVPEATAEEIQKSYKRLMLRWHPDKATPTDRSAAEEKAKQLNEAHDVLGNPERRAAYDRTRSLGFEEGDYRDLFSQYDVNINLADGVEVFSFLAGLFQRAASGTVGSGSGPGQQTVKFKVWKMFYNEKVVRLLTALAGVININNYGVKNNFFTREINFQVLNMTSAEVLRSTLQRIPTLKFLE